MIRTLILVTLLFSYMPVAGQNMDLRLLDDLHTSRNRSLDFSMACLTYTTYPIALALPLGQYINGVATGNILEMEHGLQTAGALVLATCVTFAFKYTVQRDRPYIAHPEYEPYEYNDSPSFPSGHTSLAFSTATSLAIQYKKWYVVVPAYAWAGGTGYARIHLGAHYPSDVLVGALIGTASAYVSYKGNQWLKGKWKKKKIEPYF